MEERRDKRLAVIVIAIILFGFFGYGLNIVRMWSVRTWLPDNAMRILLLNKQTKAMEVLVVWPGLGEAKLLEIPASVYLTAVGGYGNYTGEALLTLGETEGVGEKLLVDSLGFALASPIHDVYWYSGNSWQIWGIKWQLLRQGLWGSRSLGEAVEMMRLLDKVSLASLVKLKLGETAGLRQRVEVDGSIQDYWDQALLTAFLQRNLATIWPEAAKVQVAIVNASNMPQMATVWSRLAYINGFDVVNVTDGPSQQTETELVFADEKLKKSVVGKALMTLYPLAKVRVGETSLYRAKVALVIGLDSWQWLHQRAFYLAKSR